MFITKLTQKVVLLRIILLKKIEFCSAYQKEMDAIGNPINRYQKMNVKEGVGVHIKCGKTQPIN